MPKWTREQEMAIKARNHSVLVSAAAGSGKTAVLVERVVELVKEGASLERMLIITFTRAAAGEMRQRLAARLLKEAQADPDRFGRALDELENTDISTIDAFCQRVVKTDFQAVGIDPMARVCETQLRELLFEQAYRLSMNELLEKLEAGEKHEAFAKLTESFSQQKILEMAGSLYPFLMSMPDPFEWLERHVSGMSVPIKEHAWYQTLMEKTRLELDGLPILLRRMEELLEEENAAEVLRVTWEKDCQTVQSLLAFCSQGGQSMIEALQTTSFVKAETCRGLNEAQKEWKKRFDDARKALKKLVTDAADELKIDEDAAEKELASVQQCLAGLTELLKCLHDHFRTLKGEQNVVDFNDLEQMTLAVFRNEDCRAAWQERYDHIFVDECQDVSAVQDAMIQAIHGEKCCLFMVGDVKQSIYRFRLADPTLFLQRMRTYPDDENARERRIFLQKNFRSRTNVLDATNRVFRRAMKASVTELDYLPEDELVPGRETTDDPAIEIRLVDRKEASGEETLQAEANVVVRRICELMQTSFDDQGQSRNYQYRDMVILLQKKAGLGARLAEMLQEQGIPVYFDGSDNYFGLPEIRTLKALLMVIDNPMQDVPLLSTLKTLPFSLSDADLADIRRVKMGREVPIHEAFTACCEEDSSIGARCRSIRRQLDDWRFMQANMRLTDFMWYLLRETGFYAACGAYPEGELRQANLRLLCQKAAEYESRQNGGLSGFLQMIDLEMQMNDATAAKTLGENENLVRIMTMHKSKGLEFPVVFLMRMTGSMVGAHKGTLRRHSRLGVCLPYVNHELSIKRDTFGDTALKYAIHRDEQAERCRLLYVAMTRARERLIMTGCCEKQGKDNWFMPDAPYRVSEAASMMDWVMQAVCDDMQIKRLNDHETEKQPWKVISESGEDETSIREQQLKDMQPWLEQILQTLPRADALPWWQEERSVQQNQPIKTSVTSLARQQVLHDPMPMTDAEEEAEDKRQGEELVSPLRLSELPARPTFMEEKRQTSAEHGTQMHRCLSMTDLDALRDLEAGELRKELRRQINQMIERQCFQEQQFTPENVYELAKYYESDLGQRVLHADKVRREWSFNLRLNQQESTLLQGIIDCAFMENGQWVLLDYKTDRFNEEESFISRHQLQLSWYAEALKRITGIPVSEVWLYSITKGKAYPVPVMKVE